ncbi:MAG: hypothetical protein LUF89_08030 [Ruminococcus sp.]|nr:hypothetical protein [Ruminococcus sp.]
MDERYQSDSDRNNYDLDTALEKKFHEVQEDISHYRDMDTGPSYHTYDKQMQRQPRSISVQRTSQNRRTSWEDEFDIPDDFGVLDIPDEPYQTAPPEISNKQKKQKSKRKRQKPNSPSQQTKKASAHASEYLPSQSKPIPDEPEESSEERERRYKKKRSMLITTNVGQVMRTCVIGTIMLGGSIFLLVGTRPTESAEENRMLATMPSITAEGIADGSYIEDLMYYYEDTVPGRSYFKQLISDWETYKGLSSEDTVILFIGEITQVEQETIAFTEAETESTTEVTVATGTQTTVESTTVTTTTTEEEIEKDAVEVGDGIVLIGTHAISMYGGGFSKGEEYAQSLNNYKSDLGADVNVYSLVAPTSVSFYLPDSYSGYTASEIDNIEHINEYLDGVIAVDAYSTLEEHKSEEIYARTDHHWLPLGAYYAAQTFAEAAGVPFADLTDYTAITKEGYIGSMYTFTKSAVLQDNPEDFTYYIPSNDYTTTYYNTDFTNARDGNLLISLENVEPVSWYLVFMGGDEHITHVSTDVDNDRVLVMVKDSYGNAMVPCLTQSFSEIYVTDMRYFELNAIDFMQDIGATDVLFVMNTFSATGSNCSYLETNRTQ